MMEEDVTEVDEVVVTGYSVRKVSEMTGAAQQFDGRKSVIIWSTVIFYQH